MDNFNITKWNRDRYLKESKIEEYGEYKSQEIDLKKELDSEFSNYRPFISLGTYGSDRPDTDPLKGKGYGDITFSVREELSDNDWNKALKWVEDKGFEIKSESNWYEMDIDDDRAWYPKIKFQFNIADFPMNEGMNKAGIMKQIKDAEEILDSGEANGEPLTSETEMLVQNELKRLLSLYKSVNEMDINDPILVKMRAAKDAAKNQKPDFGKEYGDAVKKARSGNNNDTKLRFLKKEREQLMRDMEQEAEPEGGPIADEYGSKLNRIDKAIAKLSGRKEMTYDQAIAESASTEEKRIAMRAIKSIAKYRGVSEDEAKRDLTRAIEQLGSLKEAIKDIKENMVADKDIEKEIKKLEDENPKGFEKEIKRLKVRQAALKLAKNLKEDLCAKGKAYRKKRMAAGEKSSAYLNGRAVKVCKGQMKG